jgi:hypothetical protein
MSRRRFQSRPRRASEDVSALSESRRPSLPMPALAALARLLARLAAMEVLRNVESDPKKK